MKSFPFSIATPYAPFPPSGGLLLDVARKVRRVGQS